MKQQRLITGLTMASAMLYASAAQAADSYSPTADPVPVNIMFLIDDSGSMATCWDRDRVDSNGDGVKVDTEVCSPAVNTSSSVYKMATVVQALKNVVTNMNNARFGFAVTDPYHPSDPDGIGNTSSRAGVVVPVSEPTSTFLTRLDWLYTYYGDSLLDIPPSTRNAVPLSEALDDVGDYFETGNQAGSSVTGPPIDFYCQESHVIIITDGVTPPYNVTTNPLPDTDKSLSTAGSYSASPDFNPTSASTDGYYNRKLDNVASYLANTDLSALSNKPNGQHVTTHVLVLDNDNTLFSTTASNGGGIYSLVTDPDKLEGELWTILNTIMEGTYVVAPPVLSTQGDKLFLGYFEVKPDRPLYYGHLLAYDIDNDPKSNTYGQIDTSVSEPRWDAGEILASRFVGQQDVMKEDNNGEGIRDIYTNIDNDEIPDPFDGAHLNDLCPMMLDTSTDSEGDYPGVTAGHDVDGDGDVDTYDCIDLMDFVRGYHLAEFLSTGTARGHWKLGDIRHSQVAVAEKDPKIYTRNPYLRKFLDSGIPQTLDNCPYTSSTKCSLDVVFVTANDGMLHAFGKETGDELWAYIPQSLLGETAGAEEIAELIDMMRQETVIMDATPRIEYVWLDGYQGKGVYKSSAKDGKQSETEWARVLLVGTGGGGRYYLALDVTDGQNPYILWEDHNDGDTTLTQMGLTTSTPVAGLIYDTKGTPSYDRWVAFYGSGQPDESNQLDARLYIKAMFDQTTTSASSEAYPDEGIQVKVDVNKDGADDGTGFPSNPTAVDKDNDGDVDEVFLVNAAGVMYKFIINTSKIDKSTGCLFFDPESAKTSTGKTGQYVGARTASYWAATAAFSTDGSLMIFWGTGSPYDLFTTDYGYFYSLLDSDNSSCTAGSLNVDCNNAGYMKLESGEKLTGSAVVYAQTVYFPTFKPSTDRCSAGEARLYALNFETCKPGLDTNGNGTVDSSDANYVALGSGMPSGVVIANDSIYVATSDGVSTDDLSKAIHRISVDNDPFSGTVAIQWRELF